MGFYVATNDAATECCNEWCFKIWVKVFGTKSNGCKNLIISYLIIIIYLCKFTKTQTIDFFIYKRKTWCLNIHLKIFFIKKRQN